MHISRIIVDTTYYYICKNDEDSPPPQKKIPQTKQSLSQKSTPQDEPMSNYVDSSDEEEEREEEKNEPEDIETLVKDISHTSDERDVEDSDGVRTTRKVLLIWKSIFSHLLHDTFYVS